MGDASSPSRPAHYHPVVSLIGDRLTKARFLSFEMIDGYYPYSTYLNLAWRAAVGGESTLKNVNRTQERARILLGKRFDGAITVSLLSRTTILIRIQRDLYICYFSTRVLGMSLRSVLLLSILEPPDLVLARPCTPESDRSLISRIAVVSQVGVIVGVGDEEPVFHP